MSSKGLRSFKTIVNLGSLTLEWTEPSSQLVIENYGEKGGRYFIQQLERMVKVLSRRKGFNYLKFLVIVNRDLANLKKMNKLSIPIHVETEELRIRQPKDKSGIGIESANEEWVKSLAENREEPSWDPWPAESKS